MSRLAVILAIAACVGIITTEGLPKKRGNKRGTCPWGGLEHHDPKDPILMEGLLAGIAENDLDIFPKKIKAAWDQVDGGMKYVVDFATENGRDCHARWFLALDDDMPGNFKCLCDVNLPDEE